MNAQRPSVHVVAGVLYQSTGAFLLSSRPAGKPYAGYWEFAGGKVEAGESALAALQREFHEELGIHIEHATPWLTKIHDYEHARVRLCFYRIAASDWHGSLQAREGQSWCWQQPGDFSVAPMLPANGPILAALAIPDFLTGSLQTGFRGSLPSQAEYRIVPYDLAEPGHHHILFAADRMAHAPRFGNNISVWACVNQPQQWAQVQDAAAVLWQVLGHADAQALLAVLQQGVSLPLLPFAAADILAAYGKQWLAAGAHGLVEDLAAAIA